MPRDTPTFMDHLLLASVSVITLLVGQQKDVYNGLKLCDEVGRSIPMLVGTDLL
jgi:hypothetical protein